MNIKKPAFTHEDTMRGIYYEVARENLSAVRGQYVREQYKEEAKPQPDQQYLTQLKTEQLLVTGIINRMAGCDPAFIEKLKVDYGKKYRDNKQNIAQGEHLILSLNEN